MTHECCPEVTHSIYEYFYSSHTTPSYWWCFYFYWGVVILSVQLLSGPSFCTVVWSPVGAEAQAEAQHETIAWRRWAGKWVMVHYIIALSSFACQCLLQEGTYHMLEKCMYVQRMQFTSFDYLHNLYSCVIIVCEPHTSVKAWYDWLDSICPSHVHTKHVTQNIVHERLLMGASNVLHTPVVQYVESCCSQNTEGSTVLSQASQTSWSTQR